MSKEPNKMKGKPLASSAKDRNFKIVALLAMMLAAQLAGSTSPFANQTACQGSFYVGEPEDEMRANFPYPDQPPRRTTVVGGVEHKVYSNPCRPFNAVLFVENGRLVGWSQ